MTDNKLIEEGWLSLKKDVVALDAGPVQIDEMQMAFYAGAFHCLIRLIEPDAQNQPPEGEEVLRRVKSIHTETLTYLDERDLRIQKAEGSA